MNIYTIDTLLELDPPTWLIADILPETGLIALYGQPGAGKSFVALDMALSVAAGIPWQGHVTRMGHVVYVSAEGAAGLGKRVGAWLAVHDCSPADYDNILVHFRTSALQVYKDSNDLNEMLHDTIWHPDTLRDDAMVIMPNEDPLPTFIIIDTLARCFEGNENQQEDMNRFIQGLDQLREDNITVLVVHHTGKKGFEERGSNVFRGACDAMMTTYHTPTGLMLKCTKQKDAEEFKPIPLKLTVVEAWNSCVVESQASETQEDVPLVHGEFSAYMRENPKATTRQIAADLCLSQSTATRRLKNYRGNDR
jgi:RecA-family ATPase